MLIQELKESSTGKKLLHYLEKSLLKKIILACSRKLCFWKNRVENVSYVTQLDQN